MNQILNETQDTSYEFYLPTGTQGILVTDHAGGTWILQCSIDGSDWIDTDLDTDSDGLGSFQAFATLRYRLSGGTMGAKAYVTKALIIS